VRSPRWDNPAIAAAHRIDVARLDRDRPAPAGSVVVVDLRDRRDVSAAESRRIRSLVIDAEVTTVVGGTGPARSVDHPDIGVPGGPA